MPAHTSILILNGPNLNLLGSREPQIYGHESLEDIAERCRQHGQKRGWNVHFVQSNHEGILIDWIHEAKTRHQGLIVNAGAYTHSSIALLDALLAVALPVIEVHLSNLAKREAFRHHSYVARAAIGTICGFGAAGYCLALDAMASLLQRSDGTDVTEHE